MSRLGREIGRGIRELRKAEAKPTFRWNNGDIPCVANEAASSKIFGQGGFTFQADLTIFVQATDLPDPGPQESDSIVYRGRQYRIDNRANLPGDEQVRLACTDPNKGV